MAAGSPTALVAGSVTAQSPRPHQLRCGAAGIGNLRARVTLTNRQSVLIYEYTPSG
jgi:hypothetical protein